MWELLGLLTPEIIGLMVTPAAIVGCLLLLGSSHPLRNVALFAASFLVSYAVLSVIAIGIGHGVGGSNKYVRDWISLVVGVLFLVGGLISLIRGRRARRTTQSGPPAAPGWVSRLADPKPRGVLVLGLVMALANPNVAILASGLSMIMLSGLHLSEEIIAVLVLLLAAMLDFIVPTALFLVCRTRGRRSLEALTQWLIKHNQTIGTVVLLGFGLLFLGRGLARLIS